MLYEVITIEGIKVRDALKKELEDKGVEIPNLPANATWVAEGEEAIKAKSEIVVV